MDKLPVFAFRRNNARPTDDKRNAMSAFPSIRLRATKRTAWEMSLLFKLFDPNVMRTAIVACEDDNRVVANAAFFNCFQNLTDNRIRFHYQVRVQIQSTLALPPFVDGQRRVRRREGPINQKWFVCFRFPTNELRRAISESGQDRFQRPIFESRTLLTRLILNEQLGCTVLAGDADRSIIFNETVRRPVGNVSAEVLVKPNRSRSVCDGFGKDFAPSRFVFVGGHAVLFVLVA